MYDMRKCQNCGNALAFSAKGQSRGEYCSAPECKRVRDRERKRAQRSGKTAKPPEPSAPVVSERQGEQTRAQVLDSPTVAPWGQEFETLSELWHWALATSERDPFGRDLFLVLCEAADAEPHRYPSPNTYGLPW